MKVAISSTGKDLNAQIDPRFGRCAFFVIVDTNDMSFVSYDNENVNLGGGAGIQAAGFVVSKGAEAVLTGNCGPNAIKTFSAAGVTVHTGQTGTVEEAVNRFKAGALTPSTQATVPEKAGVSANVGSPAVPAAGIGRCRGGAGRGLGMGMKKGMGGGRGMGMGMGSGAGFSNSGSAVTPAGPREETVASLKKQADQLQQQMKEIQDRIDSIK